MKTIVAIGALALSLASAAYAIDVPNVPANDNMQQANPKAAKNFRDLSQKTKRGAKMAVAKTQRALGSGAQASARPARGSGTAAMGAPAGSVADTSAARQRRMDEAYANWQAQQARR